jgi:uncharacterized protein (DUF433 family)
MTGIYYDFYIKGKTMQELSAFITIDPEICFGKPCIKGTRITVSNILDWLSTGMTIEDIIEDYPELHTAHIRAALNVSM